MPAELYHEKHTQRSIRSFLLPSLPLLCCNNILKKQNTRPPFLGFLPSSSLLLHTHPKSCDLLCFIAEDAPALIGANAERGESARALCCLLPLLLLLFAMEVLGRVPQALRVVLLELEQGD